MHLLLWFAVCLGTVGFVRSDLEMSLNITKPFVGLFDNFFRLPPLFSFPQNVPSTENPASHKPTTEKPTTEKPTVLQTLYKELNAPQPDEDTIIRILLENTYFQLRDLELNYFIHYKVGLIESLRNVLTGELEKAVVSWMIRRNDYYALEIYNAIHGICSDERALIDILFTFNDTAIAIISKAYSDVYHKSMTADLLKTPFGLNGKLLHLPRPLSSYDEYDSNNVLKIAENELSFIDFVTKHPSDVFRFAMDYYRQSGKYLESTIMEKYSGDLQRTLLSIVYYAKGENRFFARRLHDSLEGETVDYHSLIRLAIMEKRVSYYEICDLYKRQYKKNLDEVMTNKITSRNFRKFIQALFKRKQDLSELYHVEERVIFLH